MHTLIGYTSSDAASAALVALGNSVGDQTLTTRGNGYIVTSPMLYLARVYGMGASINRLQAQSGKLGAQWNPDFGPLDVASVPSTATPFADLSSSPILLKAGEELDCFRQASVVAAERDYAGFWLSDGPVQSVMGQSFPLRATGATTLVANTWTAVPLTFPKPLPSANYQIVGARFHSATGVLGRLIVPGQFWRPGAIAFSTVAKMDNNSFRYGAFGYWGQFNVASPPQAEFLATGTEATQEVILDLIEMP